MSTMHEPARDRVLGPLVAPLGRVLAERLPAWAAAAAGMLVAAGALAAFLAGNNVVAGLLVLAAGLLDAAGALRRREGTGIVLDGMADRYADTLILAGMAAWSHSHESRPAAPAVAFAALAGVVVLSYMVARVRASAGPDAVALFSWTGRDVRVLVAAAGALTGQVYVALLLLCVLTHGPVLWALLRLRTLLRGA
jgi:phosphatidylglycerophosphate synthase